MLYTGQKVMAEMLLSMKCYNNEITKKPPFTNKKFFNPVVGEGDLIGKQRFSVL